MNAPDPRFDDILELTNVVPGIIDQPRAVVTIARLIDFFLAFLLTYLCL
jgi:hypothetical protein